MAQNVLPCSCSNPPPASASVGKKKGIVELRNQNISVRHKLSDLLEAPPRDDAVEEDGGNFLGGRGGVMGSLKNKSLIEWPT